MKSLAEKYSQDDLAIVVFPCDEFGGQELGTDAEIAAFAAKSGFVGTLVAKAAVVNGPGAGPTYQFLQAAGMANVGWNFDGKFLVSRTGEVSFTSDPAADIASLI